MRAAALQAGDVDIIEGVPWQNMDALERNSPEWRRASDIVLVSEPAARQQQRKRG